MLAPAGFRQKLRVIREKFRLRGGAGMRIAVRCSHLILFAGACLFTATQDSVAQSVALATKTPGKVYLLPATLETTQWGWFNNAQPPVLRVDSGDTVVMETMMHAHNQVVPGRTVEEIKN